ncbi:MAG: CRTAC1 family protein [Acidobacteria bacterium]|nr:MAG: CRTAC1 family protein [Acidobacteriota bacterium]
MHHKRRGESFTIGALGVLMTLGLAVGAFADGGVTFTDVADGDGAGITYRRVPSPDRLALQQSVLANSPYPIPIFFPQIRPNTPQKPRGAPGVAILDYDGDGDLDIYVTNGPGADNSLYQNQLVETGSVTFIDRGASAGVGAFDQDSSGVCFGDIDNDGDEDLYVLGTGEPGRLFENQGDGTFLDVTATAGVGGGDRHSVGCSFADFDGDGLLDVVVGNTYDGWEHRLPTFISGPTYPFMEHNQLFRNTGGNVFEDVSAASGIENVSNMGFPGLSGGAYTWAIAAADYDLDGDADIFSLDNQGGAPLDPTQNRGAIRLYQNDGTGHFVEVTAAAGLNVLGAWMGIDFGDFNCDGGIDFFATDLGYLFNNSRWWLSDGNGGFVDPGVGALARTPFGWGVSVIDYDNDADADVIYHGGVDLLFFTMADNPGALLQNKGLCSADFDYDAGALLKDHRFRQVEGVAAGDLDGNGFEDIVSVSSHDVAPLFVLPVPGFITPPTGSPFDPIAVFELNFSTRPVPGNFTYIGRRDADGNPLPQPNGTLSVELNSGGNGNGWVAFDLVGSAGILDGDSDSDSGDSDSDSGDSDSGDSDSGNVRVVNRDGIGAVVFFTPDGGPTSIRPITGGSSYASQDSLTANFGLGSAAAGTVEVLWPGGVRNRLYDVASEETVVLPHIPCSFDGVWKNRGQYNNCVQKALDEYEDEGIIDGDERKRLRDSARRAFDEFQGS